MKERLLNYYVTGGMVESLKVFLKSGIDRSLFLVPLPYY